MNKKKIEAAVYMLLEGLEIDPDDHNFKDTPARVARVFAEVFNPPETKWPVFDEDYTDFVMLRGHEFYTFCPHHLLPVKLRASVAYIPGGKVIGASKLARLMHDANQGPMTQERLTNAIVEKIELLTEDTTRGVAVYIEGEHGCFRIRGVRTEATLVTFKFSGVFDLEEEKQRHFLNLVRGP